MYCPRTIAVGAFLSTSSFAIEEISRYRHMYPTLFMTEYLFIEFRISSALSKLRATGFSKNTATPFSIAFISSPLAKGGVVT